MRSKITFAKKPKIVETSQSDEGVETPDKCPICLSPLGPGHKHSRKTCKSSKTLLDNLEKQLPPKIQEQFASRIINRVEKNSAGQSVLHNVGGKPKLVSEGPVVEPVQISHNTFLKIEREVGLSGNQINNVKSILTGDTKRNLVEPYLKQALIDQRRVCNEYFHVNKDLALIGKDDLPIKRPFFCVKMFQIS